MKENTKGIEGKERELKGRENKKETEGKEKGLKGRGGEGRKGKGGGEGM